MTRIMTIALSILALAVTLARADEERKEEPKRTRAGNGGWGSYGIYVGMFQFADFNSQLKGLASDFTACSGTHFMHGGGGMAEMGRVTIAGYGFGGAQRVRSESLGVRLDADYGGGVFEAGWLPIATRHFMLGPALAIGGGGFSLRGSPSSESDIGFDSLLLKGTRGWRISGGSFVLAPTLNILIPVKWVGLALKVGYLWAPFDNNWSFDDGPDVYPPPKLHSSGPFASLQLMLGGSDEGRKTQIKIKAEGKSEDENKQENKEENDNDYER